MSHFKKLATIFITTFCLTALANQSGTNMEERKTLVISYDYPQERVLNESTVRLHQNTKSSFHGEGNFDVLILGEKQKMIIPAMQESFLDFDKTFESVRLFLLPTDQWSTLSESKEQIAKMTEKLKPIRDIALKIEEFDIGKLNSEHFSKKGAETISKYELEHYYIFFVIKKLNTPKEIHPRDEDYFQLNIRVENKNLYV